MIEIDDIIELRTYTETERLLLEARYLVYSNFTFDLKVVSEGFSGTSHFCVRREQLEKMCSDLTNIHSTLTGTTILEDNDSDGFIKFDIENDGKLNVSGQVGGTHEDHFLKFKFQTDQTCIPELIKDFYALLKYEYN